MKVRRRVSFGDTSVIAPPATTAFESWHAVVRELPMNAEYAACQFEVVDDREAVLDAMRKPLPPEDKAPIPSAASQELTNLAMRLGNCQSKLRVIRGLANEAMQDGREPDGVRDLVKAIWEIAGRAS